jgi:hypothetical protein
MEAGLYGVAHNEIAWPIEYFLTDVGIGGASAIGPRTGNAGLGDRRCVDLQRVLFDDYKMQESRHSFIQWLRIQVGLIWRLLILYLLIRYLWVCSI